jgi:DNA-binding transcriptional ArsR family regulator
MIDVYRLGWTRYQVFFASAVRTARDKSKLLSFLIDSPRVSFVGEMGGDFDYEVLFLGKHSNEVTDLLEECTRRCGEFAVSKSVIIHQSVSFFPRKYLATKPMSPEEMSFVQGGNDSAELSDLDQHLLEVLTRRPDVTKREMAALTGKSPPTVDKHISRLEEAGILRGSIFSVDAGQFGGQYFVLMVHARGFDSQFGTQLHTFVARHPHCTNFRR